LPFLASAPIAASSSSSSSASSAAPLAGSTLTSQQPTKKRKIAEVQSSLLEIALEHTGADGKINWTSLAQSWTQKHPDSDKTTVTQLKSAHQTAKNKAASSDAALPKPKKPKHTGSLANFLVRTPSPSVLAAPSLASSSSSSSSASPTHAAPAVPQHLAAAQHPQAARYASPPRRDDDMDADD